MGAVEASRATIATRIDELTADQAAQLSVHADRWIKTGLRMGPADRPAFEAAACQCYLYAQVPWHGNVIWVSSLVVAPAGSAADLLIQRHHLGTPRLKAVDSVVHLLRQKHWWPGEGANDSVRDRISDAVAVPVREAVARTVEGAAGNFVGQGTPDVVRGALDGTWNAVARAVHHTDRNACSDAMLGAVHCAVHQAAPRAPHELARDLIDGIIRKALLRAVDRASAAAFCPVPGSIHCAAPHPLPPAGGLPLGSRVETEIPSS
jgi:hypothetical protein